MEKKYMKNEMKEVQTMLKQFEQGYEAEITNIEETTNHKFFDSEKFELRKGYAVTFKAKMGENDEEWTEFFNVPNPKGFIKSKVGRFCHKYDTYPQVGMKVKVEINDDGFLRCVV